MAGAGHALFTVLAVICRSRHDIARSAHTTLYRRLATAAGALLLALLSCGREPTSPLARDGAPRFARGFSFNTVFPQMAASSAFADLVDFNRVHILLHRMDGSVALDTTVTFPPGVESLTLSLDIRLAPGAPAAGEPLSLDLAYLNAAGVVVFTGGPVSVLAVPSVAGTPPPPPVTIPVVYTGPGATARTVRISPRTLTVNTGQAFTFTAVGLDATGATMPGAPILYTVLDPTRATLASSTAGAGTALLLRGTARISAQLINGAADTATLTINPVASAIAAVSGNAQTGTVGKPTPRTLAQPLVVRVTAADGLGMEGVPVTFAAANGGSVSPATATTDANGNAQTAWTLGPTALAQTATASAAGLSGSPVTFSATGQVLPAARLSLTTAPAAGSSIASGTPIGLVVSAVDVDGDPVSTFNGSVNVALSANPAGGTLAGATSASAVSGVATFTSLNIVKPGTGYAIQATSGTLPAVTTPVFNVVPGAAATLALVSGGGQSLAAGSVLAPITALVTDANGNAKPGASVTFSVSSGGGLVTPATVVSDAAGHASATWTLGSTVGTQSLGIATAGVSPLTVTASAFSAVQTWVVTQQPAASLVAGAPVAPAVVAELRDAQNALVTGFNGSASIAIGANPGGATLGGTVAVSAVNGVATFSNLTLNKAGAGYTLAVTSSGAQAGATNTFTVVAGAASALSVASGNSQTAEVGAVLGQPVVALVTDANGNAKAGVPVTFAVTSGGGAVSPASGVTDAAGRASTTWTLGTTVGAHTLAITSAGLATASASATATSTVLTWVFTSQPAASQVAGAVLTPAVVAELRNGSNAVVTSFNGAATLTLGANPGSSALGGTATVNAVNGVATFSTPTLNKVGTGYTLVVGSSGATSATSAPFNVAAGAASVLAIASGNAQTAAAGAVLGQPVVARVTDANGNAKAGVPVSFVVTTGGGAVSVASGSTDALGQVSTTWTLGSTVGAQTLDITSAGLTTVSASATGTSTVVTWVFTAQPGATQQIAGAPLAPAVTAELRNASNAVVTSFNGAATVALGANPGGSTLGGTTTATAVNGVATFSTLTLNKAGTGYTVVVSSTGATSATSTPFTVAAGAASVLSIASGNAQTAAAGAVLGQPIVALVTDANGNAKAGVPVSFVVTTGGGAVSVASGSTDALGQVSTTWTLGATVGAQALEIRSTGLPTVAVSATGTSTALSLVITVQPASAVIAGATLAPAVTVEMRNAANAVVPSFTGAVTLAIGLNPGGATLGGITTANAVAGVATFPTLTLNKVGAGYTLVASATGAASATSTPISVAAGAASQLSIASGDAQSGAISVALTQPVVVLATDAGGNPKSGVPVSIAVTAGGGAVLPTSGTTDSTGRFSTVWTLGTTVGAQTLGVTSTGLTSATASATGTGAALSWVVTGQPGATQTAGAAITPAIVAELRGAAGALVSSFNGTATIALGANPGSSALGGTVSVTAVNGVATFAPTLNKVGTGYTLVVSSAGATSGTSSLFNVVAAAAANLSLQSGAAQSGTLGTALAAPVVALVVDAFQNPAAGATVTFAVASGGGTVGTPSATTNASGLASSTWTLGTAGVQTLTVASTGLIGSPVSTTAATGVGIITQSVVSPRGDTLTAFGATRQLSVVGRDIVGSTVAGTWTWASRNAATATVSAAGLVTALADGSVYIVATEAGGTKDSAQIVVQQRVATVSVTPGSRTLYAGAGFTFSAQAVDGLGNPMATQPVFVWSSTVPSVLSINASGVASALAIGSTQVRATSGTAVGVSNISVLTPITRIDVSVDSANAVAPDNFTMVSLGQLRTYRALARDTLLNPMTGVTFAWTSTNASVAALDLTTATTSRATSAANGITSIQASAQGVLGTATLNVSQVLAGVELTPATATVAISGTTSMLARGKDANNRYISGGSFTYSSAAATIATVGASSGLVTGVANGSANITATAGGITSNTAVITVSGSGPALLSFGRDTIGIGRGTALSIPILLSKPSATPVTVNLAVADTFAFWSTASVTIAAGTTSANATLNGRNAGTTRITAVDAGSVYATTSSVVAVQANLRMATTYFSMNATDQRSTQVLLSDPSPAGGTYVTFAFGTAGVASVSPDPAFIPAGQLAADVVIRGVAGGSTTVTPSAAGVTGAPATVNVSAAVLTLNRTFLRLGAGQNDPSEYVYVPNSLTNPLTVSLVSTNTAVASVAPSVVIPGGSNYVYWAINGSTPGSATINVTASGWSSTAMSVVTTTPALTVSGGGTLNTTAPAQNVYVYSADSTRSAHARTSSLIVRLSSSDTTVMRVVDTTATIAAGSYYTGTARVIPGGLGGSAWIRVTASGHFADSVQYTVVGPALALSYSTRYLGAGQVETGQYVYIPNAIATPLVVRLTNSDTTKGATDSTVTIPAGTNYAYFDIRGRAPGTSTLTVSAPGYTSSTSTIIVTSPKLRMYGGSLNAYSATTASLYVTDSLGSAHNRLASLAITLRSSDTTKIKVDTSVVIPAGYYYAPSNIHITAVDTGTAKIYFSAPGHAMDSTTWTVNPVSVRMSFRNYRIGARQHRNATDFYVYTPDSRGVAVPVTLTQRHASTVSLSTSTPTIAASTNYAYFGFGGLVAGGDTIIASAVGYRPDTAFITVTRPELRAYGLPSNATTTNAPATLSVYVSDSLGGYHYASDTIVVHAVSSNPSVIQPSQPYFRILKDQYYANPVVQYIGVGSATMTYSDSANSGYLSVTTNAVTLTGPSLGVSSANIMLGTGQNTGSTGLYVYTPDNVGTPLTVHLASTDVRVATVPDSLIIPAGRNYAYFGITAGDTIGTVQVQVSATGYNPTSMTTQVTIPRLSMSVTGQLYTTGLPSAFGLYARDANGNAHYVNQDLAVTLASSSPGVAAIDSTVVTIPAGQYYTQAAKWSPGAVGTAQLTASDARAIRYPYTAATSSVSVVTPAIAYSFGTASLGTGQYQDPYVYVPDAVRGAPLTITLSHVRTASSSVPSSVVIPVGTNYVYFRITGTATGSDTIAASASGYNSGRAVVNAGPGRLDPLGGWPTTLRAGDSTQVSIYTRAPNASSTNYVAAATTFTLAPNANLQFVSGGATSAVITSIVVPADGYYASMWVKAVSAGTGTASITNANYTTYTNSISVTP